ncbi:fad binding domain-containing protein [Colletotrichum incanum]|uniref:Fad binding domain-containing protein n=1 Tax=Colletotrichum incanum TaxID=1573173 RepID=A0A166TUW4_COLIC|nr:fad binding domain-containing protein [Colletotrichum incanum]
MVGLWFTSSVSFSNVELKAYLKHNKLFFLHGQCAYMGIGGDCQTGGYAQRSRSFGHFGDHKRTITMICYDGDIRDIREANDPKLFWAIVGASPGNFGIITYYVVKALWLYNKRLLNQPLTIAAEMADDRNVPRGFGLCVSVLSQHFPIATIFKELQGEK